MSDKQTGGTKPSVLRIVARDAVHFGGVTKLALSKGELDSQMERTPGGVLVRYVSPDGKGGKVKKSTFVPDANIASIDLEESQ